MLNHLETHLENISLLSLPSGVDLDGKVEYDVSHAKATVSEEPPRLSPTKPSNSAAADTTLPSLESLT
ncbi:uncharacterized protein LY79DRAFT_164906 [Colletotrichum navitas]|uniref:Uncharacterized protein n=1 Tax=Colletotrichum navitas TaxID=681940 RepID=A0AAD8Q1X6_9PEZI|nr:uncharacterized protein LY79DRAFT_164906 [Colletotrichum navitas]KAK1593950.1 hypothetical protein LY79DRAFT_164906 [Colletotrichum navitas]